MRSESAHGKISQAHRSRVPLSRGVLEFALVLAILGQSATTASATEYAIGPVYGGTLTWTTPSLAQISPAANGFLAVTTFRGRFVAVARDGIASTSSDGGGTWVGHALPGSNGGASTAQIAAGVDRVAVFAQGMAWTSIDGDTWQTASMPTLGSARPTAMAALADGFVAVGVAPGGRRATGWVSADGSSWSAVADQPAFDHFCPTAIASAATGRIVAVGDDCYPYLARPAAAISDDGGISWRRASGQTSLSEAGVLTAVIAGGPGLVAVGTVIRDVFPGRPGVAMFVSGDGLAWRRVGYFVLGAGRGRAAFLNAIPGAFLAISTNTANPRAFVSVDGSRWMESTSLPATPHAQDDDFADAINGVAVSENRILAIGTTDHVLFVDEPVLRSFALVGILTPRPAFTGRIPVPPVVPIPRPPSVSLQPAFPGRIGWDVLALPVDVPSGAVPLTSSVRDVARSRGGFAAVGSVAFKSSIDGSFIQGDDVVWTSPDGKHWVEHHLPSACASARAIAATRTAIVVAGERGICRSSDGASWILATDVPHGIKGFTDVIAGGPGFLLTMSYPGSSSVAVKVWRSVEGLHWRTAGHPGAFRNFEPLVVAAGARGVVIIGRPYVPGAGYEGTRAPLRSPDGISWSRGLRQRAFEPSSFEAGKASMIAGGPGYVAAASFQPRSRVGAAVWTSRDGLAWRRVYLVVPTSGFVEFDGLARVGPGYAVVGLVAPPSQEDPARPTLWLSPDGTRWRAGVGLPFPIDGTATGIEMTGLAGGSATLVAVGNREDEAGTSHAHVWIGTYHAP